MCIRDSPCGDNFWYEGWNGHYNLVKLNLRNPEVCDYLIDVVDFWMNEFEIDGIRFDAADCICLLYTSHLPFSSSYPAKGLIVSGLFGIAARHAASAIESSETSLPKYFIDAS